MKNKFESDEEFGHASDDVPAKKWPEGYWERYEALRDTARSACGRRSANVVALMNGHFEVRFLDSKGAEHTGPISSDRHSALEKFIAQYEVSA